MSRRFDRITGWIVARPWAGCLILTVFTATALLGHLAPHVVTDLFQTTEEEETPSTGTGFDASPPPNVDPVNLTAAESVIVVESESFFTPQAAEALRNVVADIEALDHVRSILWMDRVPMLNIFGLQEPLFPRSEASPRRFEAARERALAHPLVRGQMLSADGKTLLLLVSFDWFYVRDDDDCTGRLRRVAEEAAAAFPDVDLQFSVTGRVPTYVATMKSHEENTAKFQMIGYGMIALMAVILFRGITAVIVVAMAPSLGVFWTLGFLKFFEFQQNPFNDVVLPVLLSLVGLTDGVHLMVQIRRLRASGMNERQAARTGVQEVGLACALTSLTTAIGFGSLSLARHEVVREFGWCCAIGVLVMFVAVITVIPLACSTWLGRGIHKGHDKGLVDRHLNRIGGLVDAVLKRTRMMSTVGILLTIALTLTSLSLRPDERTSSALPMGSEAAVALKKMDKALGGLEFARVDVNWKDVVASDSPEVLEVISKVDDVLREEELIGHPLSIRSLVDALPGEGPIADRVSLLELLPPPLKRAFYTPEYRHATVAFRVRDLGIARYGPVFERIEARLKAIKAEHPEFLLDLSGSAVWRWRNLYQIVVDLAASLGSATIIIFVVLAIVYRSLRIGLISILPNLFPLAVTGTYLVLAGEGLEVVSVCAFTVCLGIAVDDTIHFLTRYREEGRRTRDEHEAIRRAFTGVGTALIMTTVVLVAGFSTVLLSDARDHRLFAAMGCLTIGSALLGDLIFLPALLARFGRAPDSEVDQESGAEEEIEAAAPAEV